MCLTETFLFTPLPKYPDVPPCRNPDCRSQEHRWRRRGLCWRCHRIRRIRERHDTLRPYHPDTPGPSREPARTCVAGPGSVELMNEMRGRWERREAMHGELEPVDLRGRGFGMLALLRDVLRPEMTTASA